MGDDDLFGEGEPTTPRKAAPFAGGATTGLKDISDIEDQLAVLASLPGVRVDLLDVTDSPDIPAEFKSAVKGPGVSRILLFWEPLLTPGRIYKMRMAQPPGSNAAEFTMVGQNINNADVTKRTLTTSIGRKNKKLDSLHISFWTDSTRVAHSAVARDITLSKLYNDGSKTIFRTVLRSIPANVSGDVVLAGDPDSYFTIGQKDEFELVFSQPASDVFVDAFIEAEAL